MGVISGQPDLNAVSIVKLSRPSSDQQVKRVIVCFDGTWDISDETHLTQAKTNVRRLYESIVERSSRDGSEQDAWYIKGLGTEWYTHYPGGLLGYGLTNKILQCYLYLALICEPSDEIYLFGFSRGAFLARSVLAMIRKCG